MNYASSVSQISEPSPTAEHVFEGQLSVMACSIRSSIASTSGVS